MLNQWDNPANLDQFGESNAHTQSTGFLKFGSGNIRTRLPAFYKVLNALVKTYKYISSYTWSFPMKQPHHPPGNTQITTLSAYLLWWKSVFLTLQRVVSCPINVFHGKIRGKNIQYQSISCKKTHLGWLNPTNVHWRFDRPKAMASPAGEAFCGGSWRKSTREDNVVFHDFLTEFHRNNKAYKICIYIYKTWIQFDS